MAKPSREPDADQYGGKSDNDADNRKPASLETLKKYFAEAAYKTKDARTNSLVCLDYYDSDQFTAEELRKLAQRNQPPIVVNRIKPAINGIVGVTEKGRSDPRCWPRNPGDNDTADAATDVLRFISDFNRFKRLKQDCFRDMLIPGTMAALVAVDEDKQVTITQIRWEEFFFDPQSRRTDFKDAKYVGVAKWMYADDLTAMYPEKAKEIDNGVEAMSSAAITGTDQSYQDRPTQYSGMLGWVDAKQRRLMVVEMYYRDNGWQRCVFTGSEVLEEGESPYTDHKGRPDCPIEAQSAYVKRDNARYGAVWDMIGPQDEINKRRSSALWRLTAKQVQVSDPMALESDKEVARAEAAKPDGVLPIGYQVVDHRADFQGHLEMLQEAKSEIERMGPSPAMTGRNEHDDSGRALLARQQSGLVELASLYAGLEDWELRIYRQCWARAKQFWTAPQFIRVTDDEDAPKFVGLNQPIPGPVGIGVHPQTGLPAVMPSVLGYKNQVAEMDVDIEIDTQPSIGNLEAEAFAQVIELVKLNPNYAAQITMADLIQMSPIQHKRALLDKLKQAADAQAQMQQQNAQIAAAAETAKIGETQARTALHGAKATEAGSNAFAKTADALTYAHATHSDHIVSGLEAGINHEQQRQAVTDSQHAQQQDQEHAASMQQSQQDHATQSQQADLEAQKQAAAGQSQD